MSSYLQDEDRIKVITDFKLCISVVIFILVSKMESVVISFEFY